MDSVFVTSGGDRLRLSEEYFAPIGKAVRADDPAHLFEVQYKTSAKPIPFGQFQFKFHESCWVFDAIRACGIPLQFRAMFDLGSGFAVMPHIVHRLGYARDVTCCDLFPYGQTAFDDGRAWRFLALQWLLNKLGLRRIGRVARKWDNRVSPENLTLPVLAPGRFDYVVSDVYEQHGQYDWVNSSLTLTHFDHQKLFPKIAALLEDGGLFTFTVECFWYARNSTGVFGKMPYLMQVLSKEDLLRYMREQHPDIDVDKVRAVYDYYADPTFPTASTYIETAIKSGLHPVFVHRHMNPGGRNARAGTTPAHIEREYGYSMSEILQLVRKRRPDVMPEDLYTSHYLIGLRKVACDQSV